LLTPAAGGLMSSWRHLLRRFNKRISLAADLQNHEEETSCPNDYSFIEKRVMFALGLRYSQY